MTAKEIREETIYWMAVRFAITTDDFFIRLENGIYYPIEKENYLKECRAFSTAVKSVLKDYEE